MLGSLPASNPSGDRQIHEDRNERLTRSHGSPVQFHGFRSIAASRHLVAEMLQNARGEIFAVSWLLILILWRKWPQVYLV